MEARAVKKYIGSSPRKMRLLVELIRNISVKESLNILKYSKKHASKEIEKTLKSAYNNLLNALDTGKIDTEDVFIKEIYVNPGPTLKRLLPAPQGRAFRIRKRSAHLTIVVENVETPEGTKTKKVKPAKPEPKPKSKTVKKSAEIETDTVKDEKPPKKTKVKKEDEIKKPSAAKRKTTKPKVKKEKTENADTETEKSDDKKEKQKKSKSKKTNKKE